jgi:hypothetical protein
MSHRQLLSRGPQAASAAVGGRAPFLRVSFAGISHVGLFVAGPRLGGSCRSHEKSR